MLKMSALNLFLGCTQHAHSREFLGLWFSGQSLRRWAEGEGESISGIFAHKYGRMIQGVFLDFCSYLYFTAMYADKDRQQ